MILVTVNITRIWMSTNVEKLFVLPIFLFHQFNLDFLDWEDHLKIYCKRNMVTRDGRKFTCDFYFVTKLIVDDLSNEKYVMML